MAVRQKIVGQFKHLPLPISGLKIFRCSSNSQLKDSKRVLEYHILHSNRHSLSRRGPLKYRFEHNLPNNIPVILKKSIAVLAQFEELAQKGKSP